MVIVTYDPNQVVDITQRFLILLKLLLCNDCSQVFGIMSCWKMVSKTCNLDRVVVAERNRISRGIGIGVWRLSCFLLYATSCIIS